jgi:serine/threonine protein kinase
MLARHVSKSSSLIFAIFFLPTSFLASPVGQWHRSNLMTMEAEYISPLQHARHAAEESHLSGVLDAYETVCAYGYLSESWHLLITQLALYLDTEYFNKSTTKPSLTFRSKVPLDIYLRQFHLRQLHVNDAELAYLASDAITALFQTTAVFAPWQHLECDVRTSYIDLVAWERYGVSERQKLVRRCLITLQYDDLHLLLDGIRHEIATQRGYLRGLRIDSDATDTWSPCSGSHLDILARLDLRMAPSDATYLQENVQYTPPVLEMPRSPTGTLLQRATSRATSFLGSQRRPQGKEGRSSMLVPISEDSKQFEILQMSSLTNMPVIETASAFGRSVSNADGRSRRDSKRSSFSDYRSFVTALTHRTGLSEHKSFATSGSRFSFATTTGTAEKRSTMQTFKSWPTAGTHTDAMANLSQWSETLKQKDIIPDPELENWSSGRGQHAEYKAKERHLIPLTVEKLLGQTNSALVESVQCMRVLLVRKIVRCNKRTRLKREDALQEVQQLYRAQHSHIVRLVGTYVIGDELAILTYPCAEWNLEQFLAITPTAAVLAERTQALTKFFTCLAKTLDFLHSFPIKHMDIKPQNILVRNIRHTTINDDDPFKIYLTDFGSSRFYPSVEDTETDSWTPFTRAYAAQEVVLQETRGLSADIFSMGCVYAEMLATVLDGLTDRSSAPPETPSHWDTLRTARSGTDQKPRPYHSKLKDVVEWLHSVLIVQTDLAAVRDWTIKMLDNDQTRRPSARDIADDPEFPPCCRSCTLRSGPEQFEAANSPPPHALSTPANPRDSQPPSLRDPPPTSPISPTYRSAVLPSPSDSPTPISTTPSSATLRAAAQATVLSTPGLPSQSLSTINFFERADRLLSLPNRRI